jgi:ATP-dependent DNA ligase
MIPLYNCQVYKEVDSAEQVYDELKNQSLGDHFFQIKQDGIWGRCVFDGKGNFFIYSKTGMLKYSSRYETELFMCEPTVLIGEFMYGSQRAQNPAVKGKFYVFDCVYSDGQDVSHSGYAQRYRLASSYVERLGLPMFDLCRCYSMNKFGEFVLTMKDGVEGFVIRNWRHTFYQPLLKFKFQVEDDFVVTGIVEGKGKHEGRMGALQLSQYDSQDQLVYVQDVGGGFSDEQRDEWWSKRHSIPVYPWVVLVRGKGRFDSGALRHPEYITLRDDKAPSQCILKRTLQ